MEEIQWQVFTYIVAQVETPLLDTVGSVVDAFLHYVRTPLQVALILHIALTGALFLYDQLEDAPGVVVRRLVLMSLVVWLITEGGAYQRYVQDLFFAILPGELTGVLTGGGVARAVTASSFDEVWMKAWRAGLEVWRMLGTLDLAEKFVVILFWFAAIAATALSFAIWLVSRLLLALSIALGPLLVGLVLFKATKPIFECWFGAMIASVLLQVTTVVLLFITLAVGNRIVGTVAAMGSTDPIAMLQVLLAGVLFFAVAGFVTLQLPAYAASLAGGLQFHTGAIVRALTDTAATVAAPAREAAREVGRRGAARAIEAARHLPQRLRPPPGGSLSGRGRHWNS